MCRRSARLRQSHTMHVSALAILMDEKTETHNLSIAARISLALDIFCTCPLWERRSGGEEVRVYWRDAGYGSVVSEVLAEYQPSKARPQNNEAEPVHAYVGKHSVSESATNVRRGVLKSERPKDSRLEGREYERGEIRSGRLSPP